MESTPAEKYFRENEKKRKPKVLIQNINNNISESKVCDIKNESVKRELLQQRLGL